MMAAANINIISLDLQEFFADDRRRSKILINDNFKKIIDLEGKITEIFGITRFHLLSDGHFLPPCEDIDLVKTGEIVCVRPSITPCKSNLLDESFYTRSYTEMKLKDEVPSKQKDKSNKEFHIEGADSIAKKRKKKQSLKENKDTLEENEYTLYASTPNNTNLFPEIAHPPKENLNKHNLSDQKKKRKTKLEKNADSDNSDFVTKKAKKRKHEVLDYDTTGDDSTLNGNCAENSNLAENKEVCRGKKKIKRSTLEKIQRNGDKTIDADFIKDGSDLENGNQKTTDTLQKNNVNIIKIDIIRESTDIVKGESLCVDLKDSNSEMSLQNGNIEEENTKNDSEEEKFCPRPLPHKKAREKESWSTLPLPNTTNLVKIIKLPIDKIEIDLTRFVFVPNEDFPPITPEEKKTINEIPPKPMEETELKNVTDSSPRNKIPSDLGDTSESKVNIDEISDKTKLANSSESSRHNRAICDTIPIPNSGNEKQNSDEDSTATKRISSSISNSNNSETDENSQDSTRSKIEAREVWRKKICEKAKLSKLAELSNSNELCAPKNKIEIEEPQYKLDLKKSEDIRNDATRENFQNQDPVKTQDTTKGFVHAINADSGAQDIPEITQSNTFEDDSFLSISILSDIGSGLETKRKRKRRHRKKKKNDMPETFFNEEFKDVSWVKNISFVPAKPKIHVRFNDSDNDLPENNTEREVKKAPGENTEITENFISDTNSQCEPETNSEASNSEPKENDKYEDCSRSQEFPNSNENTLERYKTELLKIVDSMNTVKNQIPLCQNDSSS